MPDRARKARGVALDLGEHAVAPLALEAVEGAREYAFVVHYARSLDSGFGRPEYLDPASGIAQ